MKILVLGATGNISRLTAAYLSQQGPGVQLRLASHREEGRAGLRDAFPAAEVVAADWYDPPSLANAFKGVQKALMITPDFVTDEALACANVIQAVRNEPGFEQLVRLIALAPDFVPGSICEEHLATRSGSGLHAVAKPILDASGIPLTYVNAAAWITFTLPWLFAQSIRATRELRMPASVDTPRPWLTEDDIAAATAKVLADPADENLGRSILLTSKERVTFRDIARMVGEAIGERVGYVDDDGALQQVLGDNFPAVMTYLRYETVPWARFDYPSEFESLMGRPQTTLRQYIEQNREIFI